MTNKEIGDAITNAIYRVEQNNVPAALILLQEDIFNQMDIRYAKTFLGLELQSVGGDKSFVLSDPRYQQYRIIEWPEGN